MGHSESTPIDVVLVAIRKRIEQVRELTEGSDPAWMLHVAGELAAEARLLADYVGQPSPEALARHYALERLASAERHPSAQPARVLQAVPDAKDGEEDEEEDPFLIVMNDVVAKVHEQAPDVLAYVEQTGGGCATIYAVKRVGGSDDDPVVETYPAPDGDWEVWPILAGPGSFDWSGARHLAHRDEFFIGAADELLGVGDDRQAEWTATRESTIEEMAAEIVRQVREFRPTNPFVLAKLEKAGL